MGEKRVARLMREAGLKARVEWVYRRMKNRRALLKDLPNHRLDLPRPNRANEQWSSDVTYLRLGRRWVYLVVILDLWSRRIVSWKLSDRLTAALSLSALRAALRSRRPAPGLVLHTDRGSEYRAGVMQQLLVRHGIRHSMNRPGQCTDNAEVESFFKTLKMEWFHGTSFVEIRSLRRHLRFLFECHPGADRPSSPKTTRPENHRRGRDDARGRSF